MCWEWLERGRIEEALDEEARLVETEEPEDAEPAPAEEQELVPA